MVMDHIKDPRELCIIVGSHAKHIHTFLIIMQA